MKYDILEIKKCEEKISESAIYIYNDIRLIALCGILIFSCEKGLINTDVFNVLVASGVVGSTLSVISLVKSICNIYLANEKKKEFKNDKCK